MRILVTGANGFVGRHLVADLSQRHDIVAVTRHEARIPGATENRVVPSIDSSTDWSGILRDVDVVVHAAARVHVMKETAADPLEDFLEVNARGTQKLAEACVAQGVRRLVYLSSIKVNGELTDGQPFTDFDTPKPVDPYGESKLRAEEILTDAADASELEVVILRPTLIYGEGVKGNVAKILRLVQTGIPIPLGGIRNRRSMLSIKNLNLWVERAIIEPDTPDHALLISDPSPVSTSSLVTNLSQGMGKKSRLVPLPSRVALLVARILGKGAMMQRLIGDLEVTPSYESLPGTRDLLESPSVALQRLGRTTSEATQ